MAMTRKKPRMGRPPRHAGERLSKNRTFRVRGELDDRLQTSANKSGRSVSEEIEYRLERSYQIDDLNQDMKAAIKEAIEESWAKLADVGRRYLDKPEETPSDKQVA
jgi:hypothetical protein